MDPRQYTPYTHISQIGISNSRVPQTTLETATCILHRAYQRSSRPCTLVVAGIVQQCFQVSTADAVLTSPIFPATGGPLCRSNFLLCASRVALPNALQARGGKISGSSVIVAEDKGKGARRRLSVAWGRYLGALNDQPLLTKALSSGVVSGTANVIEQTLSAAKFVSRAGGVCAHADALPSLSRP